MNLSNSSSSLERYLLFVLLLLVLLNGLLWSLIIPFDGAPDEIHKYEIVYFIWRNRRLPVFGPSADVYIRNAPGTRDGYVYGAAATYPFGAYLLAASFISLIPSRTSEVLLHTARLASVICTVFTIYFIYRIVRVLFGSGEYALVVAAFTAFIPQFTYVGAYVGDDAYQIMAVTGAILATVRGVQGSWMLRNSLFMGLALVLVSLGKQNGWIAVFPFALLGISTTWRGKNWHRRIQAWVSMYLAPALTLGSWLIRNCSLYGDPLALQVGKAAWEDYTTRIGLEWMPLIEQGYGFLDLLFKTQWLRRIFESFWGRFFYFNVKMDRSIYSALLVGSVCGLVATVWTLLRERGKAFPAKISGKILGCGGLAFVLLFASVSATSLYNDYQPQGRYFFPVVVFMVIFLTRGIYIRSRLKRPSFNLLGIALIFLFALNVFSLVHYIHSHPYPAIPLPSF
jgi:4-amino-4-deoxy-L-arabinose transferase-like glycosyltransferase